ncbi:DUF4236 domain-containing protein [Streptantibioticus silvisoli]|uniref:DUF4236 domain-containing protein n=1 Tax=Streptantibioticus silvisoli TaxID=2705255 RepID=A0ABT6W8E2_9ACTN|nr:DUF4236 domain-containing protein [Streptantibioticus silvisoli]MDI5965751.1 DUF4236 domain-containing protein [Streptantibioticus silvisoli]
MGLTYRRKIRVIPGLLDLNLGKKSHSWTLKLGPIHRTWSSTGRTTDSVDLPGPFGYRRSRTRRDA